MAGWKLSLPNPVKRGLCASDCRWMRRRIRKSFSPLSGTGKGSNSAAKKRKGDSTADPQLKCQSVAVSERGILTADKGRKSKIIGRIANLRFEISERKIRASWNRGRVHL